jgi:hypothetical protein
MNESIDFIKSGICIRSFPCTHYTLGLLSGILTVQEKETRKVVFVPSPNYYDTVEVVENE